MSTTIKTTPTLAGQPVPLVAFEQVWHIGTLKPADKGGNGQHEGAGGLSVSLDPDSWDTIARLTSDDRWTLTRPGHGFLAFSALSDAQVQALTAWGVERGYITPTTAYLVQWVDIDTELPRDRYEATLEDAECTADEEDGEITGPLLVHAATDAFPDSSVTAGALDPIDILAMVWVIEVTDLDGVWWDATDGFDPDEVHRDSVELPARGVIRGDRLDGWTKTLVHGLRVRH